MTQTFEECELLVETPSACLIKFDDGNEEWIPKSQIESRGGYEDCIEDAIELHWFELTDWICKQKGLIE